MEYNKFETEIPGFSLDNLLEGYQVIDFEWRYVYVNKTVVKHSRYSSAEDLIGFTMMEKYPGIENTRLFEILRQCMTDRISTVMENEFEFPDGGIGYFDLRIEPVPQGLFILSVDVTERKKAERTRTQYVESLELLLKITSRCVEQPVEQIMNLSDSIEKSAEAEQLKIVVSNLRSSAEQLMACRREIATLIPNT
ncbi:MAG: PAS domain-containing protein [Bacteroidia bacterium]|nr:PAS domain-containing protein [Bacteroidia bacterium]